MQMPWRGLGQQVYVSAHSNPYEGNSHNLQFSDSLGLQFQDAGLRNVVIDADLVAEWSLSPLHN